MGHDIEGHWLSRKSRTRIAAIFMKPCALILDRDGTLIRHVPYLCEPALVELLPGVREALQVAMDAGALLFLHSNQSGIGRGKFDAIAVAACNARMVDLLNLGHDPFERICIATETPDDPMVYRKPSPLFAQEIIRGYGLEPGAVCQIGDRASDLLTAQAAGIRGVGVATGLDDLRAEMQDTGIFQDFPIFDSLAAAISYLFGGS